MIFTPMYTLYTVQCTVHHSPTCVYDICIVSY